VNSAVRVCCAVVCAKSGQQVTDKNTRWHRAFRFAVALVVAVRGRPSGLPGLPIRSVFHPAYDCADDHPQLFSVNPGPAPHDALVHISLYLRCAYDTGNKAFEHR